MAGDLLPLDDLAVCEGRWINTVVCEFGRAEKELTDSVSARDTIEALKKRGIRRMIEVMD